jgi:hypothetical protein
VLAAILKRRLASNDAGTRAAVPQHVVPRSDASDRTCRLTRRANITALGIALELADFPALHTPADCVDVTHRLMTGDTRPLDWKHSFDSAGVRMADGAVAEVVGI